jgi:hypothetical protein
LYFTPHSSFCLEPSKHSSLASKQQNLTPSPTSNFPPTPISAKQFDQSQAQVPIEQLEEYTEMSTKKLTVPNMLSGFRILATPVMAYVFVHGEFRTAAAMFFGLGFTDWVRVLNALV